MPPIATIPEDNPSRPSTKLTALMDATIRNAVIAIDRLGEAVTREPSGNEMICRPPHATNTEISSWPAIFSIQSRSHKSSAMPSKLIIIAPARITHAWCDCVNNPSMKGMRDANSMDTVNPMSMPRPPNRGVGILCTSRARTSPTAPISMATCRISGVIR